MRDTSAVEIGPPRSGERPRLVAMLEAANLPTADLPDPLRDFLVARRGDDPVGMIGLESYPPLGLLRSLAVVPGCRDEGVAGLLCRSLLDEARRRGLDEVYLLTTDARGYFERHGFEAIDRETAPEAIQGTTEFRGLCPGSATLMRRRV